MSNVTKFAAYNSENDCLPVIGDCHATWLDAATEAMSHDGFAWECRELSQEDFETIYEVRDADGSLYTDFNNEADAKEEADRLTADGIACTVVTNIDDQDYKVGQFALWAKSSHHGNNVYLPKGISHKDFLRITGKSVEDCLRQFEKRGNTSMHIRYNVAVADCEFDDSGTLLKIDGVAVDLSE